MIKIYGIPNCDSVKKAQQWMNEKKIIYEFHDYKEKGISKTKLTDWLEKQPLEVLLNKKSTAWKELSTTQQAKAITKAGAISLMQEYNNLIKRPVVEMPGTILIGFNETVYKTAFDNYGR